MDTLINAAWLLIESNTINLMVLFGLAVIMVKVSRNIIVISFMMYYVSYLIADYSMHIIELEIPAAYIGEYQRTWHILLGIVGALVMLFLFLDGLVNDHTDSMRLCVVLTSAYIMIFYIVPNVGFAGFTSPVHDDYYNLYGMLGPVFDIALIALSIVKERGDECDKMAYNG
jgi:hypothetical protein